MVSSITHILRGQVDFWALALAGTASMAIMSIFFKKHTLFVGAVLGMLPIALLPDIAIPIPECCAFVRDVEPAWLLPSGFFLLSLAVIHYVCSPVRRSENHYLIDDSCFGDHTYVREDKRGEEWKIEDIPAVVAEMRDAYNSGITRPIKSRIEQLKKLLLFFADNEQSILEAVRADLGRPDMEITLYEYDMCVAEIKSMIKNLEEWSQPEAVGFHLLAFPSWQYVQPEPLGLALVIGTWNYPVQLTITPLAAAIAAGNTAILKPSNISKNTARLLAEQLPKYVDPRVVQVIGANYDVTPEFDGDYHVSTELLKHKYDMIFFTGSPNVGKVVMKAAAQHLTRVVLELGGKNPVYIDPSADLDLAAKRCVWARMFNAGQQCIAPDYVLCHKSVQEKFIKLCVKHTKLMYDLTPECESVGRIVSDKRMTVLKKLLKDMTAYGDNFAIGGQFHDAKKYIDPTIAVVKDVDSPFMVEETFGPILGVVGVSGVNEAIHYINQNEKPLALYAFTNDEHVARVIINNTSSGGVTINNCLYHAGHPGLPFGGVGNSGTGAYHGKHGFDAFSHMKPVLHKSVWSDLGLLSDPFFLYPPYTPFKRSLVRNLAQNA